VEWIEGKLRALPQVPTGAFTQNVSCWSSSRSSDDAGFEGDAPSARGAQTGDVEKPFCAPFRHDPRRAARPHDDGKSRRLQGAAPFAAPQAQGGASRRRGDRAAVDAILLSAVVAVLASGNPDRP
jgi:hypothetical protein